MLQNRLFVSVFNKIKLTSSKEISDLKELQKICSKTTNENGLYRINNYTKIKKDELVKQMNVIYDLLVFD